MLLFLVSLVPLLFLVAKPLPLHLPSWASDMRLLSALLCQEFLAHSIHCLKSYKSVCTQILKFSPAMFTVSRIVNAAVCTQIFKFSPAMFTVSRIVNAAAADAEEAEAESEMTVLDLPELALEMILEKLTPAGLLNMASVCTSLRGRCRSDHLWERHFREKWGRVIGESARKEWESYFMSVTECRKSGSARSRRGTNWVLEALLCTWPCYWFVSRPSCPHSNREGRHLRPDESVMACYLELESGRYWFPAQVYNREQNGHVGFMLSCYDAELSYDSYTDTFNARYPPHEQRASNVEEGVRWERLRPPQVDTPAYDLHVSDCLHDLRPGDHIEIQWRRSKEFPYGWWYGVVGHLESCDGDEHHCCCYNSDTVVLEFNQYSPGSRWRRAVVDRKDHREEGSESEGFYGGIRKLYDENEISAWRRLWPATVPE